jgi:hypothetical protein
MMGNPDNKDAHANLIQHIPSNTTGAEIGVWEGNTSKLMLNKNLKHLHLVDSWSTVPYKNQPNNEHGSYEQYLLKYQRLTGRPDEESFKKYYDSIYEKVVSKFKNNTNVTIHRQTSKEWFETFSEDLLDWIYVDGDHSYEGCLYDLNQAKNVVKPGGFIFGDDYRWTIRHGKAGVTKAVKEFVAENNYNIEQIGMLQFKIVI